MSHKTIVVCLPLLAFAACKTINKKSNSPANITNVSDAIQGNSSALEAKSETTPPVVTQPTESTVTVPGNNDGKVGDQDDNGDNQNQNQNGPSVPETKHECETLVIDFDNGPEAKLKELDTLNDQYKKWKISFIAHKDMGNNNVQYDVKPTLVKTPQTGLGASPHADGNTNGGYVKIMFAQPTSIINADFIDVDNNSSYLELYTVNAHGDYVTKSKQAIPQRADKETANLSVDDHSYIRKMTIKFTGSSAVDNIKICVKN